MLFRSVEGIRAGSGHSAGGALGAAGRTRHTANEEKEKKQRGDKTRQVSDTK